MIVYAGRRTAASCRLPPLHHQPETFGVKNVGTKMSGEVTDSEQDKKRTNVEDDRLSSLPDDLIHKILSFTGLKCAIGASTLSSRWRFIWTSMPCLDFSDRDFRTLTKFSEFVNHVLSHRNNLAEVFSIKLHFCGDSTQDFVKQILNYAFSHNIQQLDVTCLLNNNIEFPLSLFSSRSLKHLSLTKAFSISSFAYSLTGTSTWDLPGLTTLYLFDVTLCDINNDKCVGLFSKCVNLKNLTLEKCNMMGVNSLSICHPRLSKLTLQQDYGRWDVFNLVTPQLKILTIRNSLWEQYRISAPQLSSLIYSGSRPLLLSTDGLHYLEKLDLRVNNLDHSDGPAIIRLFQQFQSVKILSLNLEILELLSSYLEIISRKPSPFANLKSLKISPVKTLPDGKDEAPEEVNMSIKVKNYLLNNSPNAIFTMVSREEIREMKNFELAQNLMETLRVRLEREKSYMERGEVPMETHNTKIHEKQKTKTDNLLLMIEERTAQINRCRDDLNVQLKKKKKKTLDIISRLQGIKDVLTKLPSSKRAELQACYSSLCSEADFLLKKMLEDYLKIQCDLKGNRFSGYIQEFASTSQ